MRSLVVRKSSHQEHLCCKTRDDELNLKHTEDDGARRISMDCTWLTGLLQPSSVAERSSREELKYSVAAEHVKWVISYLVKR